MKKKSLFEFYVEDYNGKIIPDVEAFDRVIHEATAYVDTFCINRENLKYKAIHTKYRMAICAAAESLHQSSVIFSTTQKQSESVGNHSVSYKVQTPAEFEAEKRRKVMTFLYGTGLMYSAL